MRGLANQGAITLPPTLVRVKRVLNTSLEDVPISDQRPWCPCMRTRLRTVAGGVLTAQLRS